MIEAALIIQMVVGTLNIHHVRIIRDHDYMNHSVCMYIAHKTRKKWEGKAEIIYIGCPDHWSET